MRQTVYKHFVLCTWHSYIKWNAPTKHWFNYMTRGISQDDVCDQSSAYPAPWQSECFTAPNMNKKCEKASKKSTWKAVKLQKGLSGQAVLNKHWDNISLFWRETRNVKWVGILGADSMHGFPFSVSNVECVNTEKHHQQSCLFPQHRGHKYW